MEEIEKFCNDKFRDVIDKHKAKVRLMEDDHEKTLKMLQLQPLSLNQRDQCHQTLFEELQQKTFVSSVDQFIQTMITPVDNQSVQMSVDEDCC